MGPIQATSVPPSSSALRSPWHSPVPYLFGGLAAMLGLIAFALLILACSYWKLSGYIEGGERQDGERDLEAGQANGDSNGDLKQQPAPAAFEPKFVVVMAGQGKPTFLATPISSRASSFGSSNSNCSCSSETTVSSEEEVAASGKVKLAGDGDQVQTGNMENHAPADQAP